MAKTNKTSKKSPAKQAPAAVRKGVPKLRLYPYFGALVRESGRALTREALADAARKRVEAANGGVFEGLADRVNLFFRETWNRARFRQAPYGVKGVSGGVVFGKPTSDGNETLVWDAKATVVPAPAGMEVEKSPAKSPAKKAAPAAKS